MPTLGVTSDIVEQFLIASATELVEFKPEAMALRDEREASGLGDRWSEMQRTTIKPEIDAKLKGFKIDAVQLYEPRRRIILPKLGSWEGGRGSECKDRFG